MKIFITGSSGFIGTNLTKRYSFEHEVFEFHNTMNLKNELEKFQPDWIINCGVEIYDKDKMWLANVVFVQECLEYVKANTSTKMIQLGSSSEYGPYDRATIECDATNPTDMYSATKIAATALCQGYANSYKLDIVIVRPYSPYGPGEKPHRLFPKLWKSFCLGQPMELVMGVHDFCYIDDFVDAIDLIMNSNDRIPGEIINVSNGEQISNADVLVAFQQATNKQGAVTLVNKFVTPPIWKCDNSYIKNRYGWFPKYNILTGVKQFIKQANYE